MISSHLLSGRNVRGFVVGTVLLLGSVATAASPANAKSPTLDGETFAMRTIVDAQQGGMPFVALLVPDTWAVVGEVRWRYENVSQPVTAYARFTNPTKTEELTVFPQTACVWLQGAAAYNQPGTT